MGWMDTRARWIGWLVAALVLGCSGARDDTELFDSGGAAIIGGKLASEYPEAAYLDIDADAARVYACSAVLIAPKVVLTAGHCVDGHASWQVHVGAETRTSRSGVTYDWREAGATTVNPNHHDIGLVFLEAPISLASYPTLAKAKVPDGTKALNVGRILDGKLTNQLYGAPVEVKDAAPIGYRYDYFATRVIEPGDSGGPVFAYGTHRILAVNSGAGASIEVLARVDLLAAWIEEQIAGHGGREPSDAPPPAAPPAPPPPPGAPGPLACGGPAETEPNEVWASATRLDAGSLCGAISSPMDRDCFAARLGRGAVSIELTGDGDASFAVGAAQGSTCTPTMPGLRRLAMTNRSALTLCVCVTSPSGVAQRYTISRVDP